MAYECSILVDSIAAGVRLTTFKVRFPRFILAEFNTHRVFSRNYESSRAIGVDERIRQVEEDPFIPMEFGSKRRSMQAGPALAGDDHASSEAVWRGAIQAAIDRARELSKLGVHKQLANRILEPFAWVTGIITATEWENFFALRCNAAAQPEFQQIAGMMRDVMEHTKPVEQQYHLPYASPGNYGPFRDLALLSAARCSRVSYNRGPREPEEDRLHADGLLSRGHMSPFEHPARTAIGTGIQFVGGFLGNFRYPWVQFRKLLPGEGVFRG